MKKFLLLILILIISGCSASQKTNKNLNLTKNNMENTSTSLSADNNKNSLVINSGGKEIQLEDLASEYSQAVLKTNLGNIKIKFYSEESPLTVNNFLNLAKAGFYNDTLFHRVISDFMIQGGDPLSKEEDWMIHGTGGPGYKFKDEINAHELVRGSFAMANAGPNTNGSQFFIVTAESTPWLDGMHTNFGYVVDGMDVVEKIEAVEKNKRDHPLEDVMIKSIELVK